MKNLKRYKLKALFLSCCILLGIIFPVLFNFLDISDYNSINDSSNTFIYSLKGREYRAKYITSKDVEEMKQRIDTQPKSSRSRSNVIIDGHGTGYAVNPEDLDALVGKISLLEVIPKDSQKYRATADLSTEIYFPTVGDQGSQGSCSAWANAYYAYGYLEAKDYGWDASSGNPNYLLSPAWAYNIVAAYDYGSIPYEVAQVLLDWGVPTLSAMPYDDSDVDSWGNETAWRQAPYHRPFNYTLITYTGPATIDLMKSLITAGIPVTIGIDAYQFSNGLDEGTMDFILSSDEYDSTSLNHAQCLVGFDDAITEGSDVGAFRVVNSWGDIWMDNGYYWLTYDAFAEFAGLGGQVIMYIEDRIDYNPDIIATWEFSSAPTRMDDIITLGVGPHDSPFNTTIPFYDGDTNNLFPDFMALDISDFYSYYTIDNDVFFFLEIGPSDTTGTISSFKLERYLGGVLQEISKESPNVPKDTPGYVNATFKIFLHELRVTLDVPTNPTIHNSYEVKAMVINNGASDEIDVDFELLLNGLSVDSMTISSLLSGANATINYSWTPTEYEVYNFTAQAPPISGETFKSNNYATEILYILGPIFFDDFESGLSKWVSITGLWHLTNTSSFWPDSYHSPIHSMWFGNESTGNYDTGLREVGDMTSIPINLTDVDVAFLEFYHWRAGEGYGWDISSVYISINGIDWDLIYQVDDSYIPPWEKVSVDISAYVGNPSVQVRFEFDTIDEIANNYRGWLIDDVSVKGTGIQIPHDLRVSLEVPEDPEIFTTYTINATVTNIGTNSESDVELFLYLNGVEVYSSYYPSFPIYSSQGFSYIWTPTTYGEYNFTAYAPPVPSEEFTHDNLVTEFIHLHEINLFDGMFLDYSFEIFGTTYSWNSLYSELSDGIFHHDYSIYQGGSLATAGDWDVDSQTRIMSDSTGGFSFGSGTHTPMWIFTDISIGDSIPIAIDAEGDHIFNVTGDFLYDLPGFDLVDVWILEDLTLPGGIAWYEKSTGILLYGDFLYMGGTNNYIFDLIDTNAPFEYIIFDHELKVYLETPISHKIDETYLINATVKNNGLNDETNVELFLYLDELLVASITIPTLSVGMEQTIQYIWTPTEYGTYNFTAYAPAVPLESYIENNKKTTFVYLFETALFDGLYIEHIFSQGGFDYNTKFIYTYLTASLYQVTFEVKYGGTTVIYTWMVDALTRIMSGGSVFGDGAHTNAWIFTNTSLFDTIPIAVDGEGDHDFYVARELIYDLPGFGQVEVWELEDLDVSGGIAWYEKSTGILLKGTFLYSGGLFNYTFEFVDTNAELNIIEAPGPFTLSSNAENPDKNGIFDLIWTAASRANNYSVYRSSSFITHIDGSLTLLADEITDLTLALSGYEDGTYYFIIVAHNDYGDRLSNCISVIVLLEGIPGYNLLLIIATLGIVTILIVKKKYKTK
ncbi:MAG: CARDB domain-containing protein [Promethearchaeota archaeon]